MLKNSFARWAAKVTILFHVLCRIRGVGLSYLQLLVSYLQLLVSYLQLLVSYLQLLVSYLQLLVSYLQLLVSYLQLLVLYLQLLVTKGMTKLLAHTRHLLTMTVFRIRLKKVWCPALDNNYASPTSGEAYRDRRLTTNFEL